MTPDPAPTVGAVLAGGLARRMGGGDKSLRSIGGRTVLDRIIKRLTPQVRRVILNANADPRRFDAFHLPVVADSVPDNPGPLAGVISALDWTASVDPSFAWVLTLPGDAPFIPRDLVSRLHAARQAADALLACATSDNRTHPVIALWPVSIRDELRRAVADQGIRKIEDFTRRYRRATADWPITPVDPFFNVNTPDDLAEADRLLASHPDL
ncbi:MAG: molybdenum cofactor guanylyltransferase MobA [Alphaproteobacteria bacterium]|nr:molybdenum cofactor guanylyltransferase MobA [Alphaproteobacteria bacterium]MBV8409761.1 molybdenum cofactor guanylyltransferase MobA [Alphaproteobacteria bacterium]